MLRDLKEMVKLALVIRHLNAGLTTCAKSESLCVFCQISMSVKPWTRVMKTRTASTSTDLTHALADRDSLEMNPLA